MGISKQEFARRRKTLMEHMEPNSIAIVPSAATHIRNRDADYSFRQDSDFYYLSGFNEPLAVLVLIPGREHGETIMFCRERDKEKEIWDGYIAGPDGACVDHGADDAFPIDDIDDILPGLIEGTERVYYAMGKNSDFDRQVMDWVNTIRAKVRAGATPPGEFLDLDHYLHDMRLFKSTAELRIMKKAGEISARAHARAMQVTKPGLFEYQIEAELRHEFGYSGAREVAYNPIVGGGDNACILHYIENNQKLKDGDLLLIDAGCELDFYAADITRTFPVNGKFSPEQKAIYDLVLKAQLEAMKAIKPGNHWNDPHEVSVKVITEGLLELGLLRGSLEDCIESESYKQFYMHRIGHWLGMDVHDVGDYKVGGEWRVLEPGMVMTVEPGIYVAPDDESVDKKWRGIGIRIEDDVVITKEGCEELSVGVPKTTADIEALMAS
ncbi:Xaa-Pro aminopeptidase [Aurantivibrio infirmus]